MAARDHSAEAGECDLDRKAHTEQKDQPFRITHVPGELIAQQARNRQCG